MTPTDGHRQTFDKQHLRMFLFTALASQDSRSKDLWEWSLSAAARVYISKTRDIICDNPIGADLKNNLIRLDEKLNCTPRLFSDPPTQPCFQ